MQISPGLLVLQAIFRMSAESLPFNRSVLARSLGLTSSALEQHLLVLEQRGFVDACRLRLTLAGLALAASMRRRRAQRERVEARPPSFSNGRRIGVAVRTRSLARAS